jgi:ATP-dependent DNA ligase
MTAAQSGRSAAEAAGDVIPIDLPPMEARSVEVLPEGQGEWQYEPKWDGFRCLAFKDSGKVELRAKSGKPLARYFPEVVAVLAETPATRFIVDGELVIELEGRLSFEALQARLHPAESRIRKLAAATPARLVLFDILLTPDGRNLTAAPLFERRPALESFVARCGVPGRLVLSPMSRDLAVALEWLAQSGHGSLDGVIAKRLEGAYEAGERAMIKVKPRRTADCVVGGFRYQNGGGLVGSMLLGLYDNDGRLNHVGFTATISDRERPVLTRRLEALIEPPGFTGSAPGGPSRWSTDRSADWRPLRPELVVEVEYDQVTGGRFRHGTRLLRWRPDKAAIQCTDEQIAAPRQV